MTRPVSVLSAVLLTALQPALAMCQCVGCAGSCAPQNEGQSDSKRSASKSCCGAAQNAQTTCCGSSATTCACSSANSSGASHSDSQSHAACHCSFQPTSTAIATAVVQIDHAPGGHEAFFLPAASPHDLSTAGALTAVPLPDGGSPAHYGGLRVHAFLGVWLI